MHVISASQLKHNPAEMGALDPEGRVVVHPAEYWRQFTQPEIMNFCVQHGIYCIPTVELVEWLRGEIGDQRAIEIGSGNGVLAEALGIPATDNMMQTWPDISALYRAAQQQTITYGKNVRTLSAAEAVRGLEPDIVIAAWVTQLFDPRRGGNMYGVAEELIVQAARYCFVGNLRVHKDKTILEMPHREHRFPWLVSRAIDPSLNFIGVWEKAPKAPKAPILCDPPLRKG